MMIRLTEWAARQGIAYITAFRWAGRGKVPGLHRAVSGRLFVEVPDGPLAPVSNLKAERLKVLLREALAMIETP